MERIYVSGPWITQKEVDYVAEAAANAWYSNSFAYQQRFEKAFAEYLGRRYAVSLPSCTAGIHLALMALGIGEGDEVIVPEITWIASSAPISYVGATPVFADVEADTWCLSAESVKRCLTPRTKAILPVDLYGSMADYEALEKVAREHHLGMVEDAAEAVGSEYKGRRAGAFGEIGVYSFHGSKTLTTGEGGMLVTDREDLFNRILFQRDHGRAPGDFMFYNAEVGYKYKMSSLQAALGLAQLERINELVDRKREIFGWYTQELKGVPGLTMNVEPPGTKNSYWMTTVILDPAYGVDKAELMRLFREENIDTRPFFHPLSAIPAYNKTEQAQRARERNQVAYRISGTGINLPSGLNLTRAQVQRVCEVLKRILETRKPKRGVAE